MARRRSRDSRSSLPALTHTLPHCTSIGNSFLCSALMLSALCTCSFKDNSKEVSQAKVYFYSWSLGIALGSGWKAEHWVDPTCPATQTLVRFPNLHYFQVILRIWPNRPQMGNTLQQMPLRQFDAVQQMLQCNPMHYNIWRSIIQDSATNASVCCSQANAAKPLHGKA